MMRETYRLLQRGAPSQFDRNMHIEAYHLHARNLIEFFKNKDPCDIDPRRFTQSGYEPDGNFIDSKLEAKINQQISHLTAKRTDQHKEQLGPQQWSEVNQAIDKQISRFEKALTDDSKKLWEQGLQEMDFSLKLYLSAEIMSTTNHVVIVKS